MSETQPKPVCFELPKEEFCTESKEANPDLLKRLETTKDTQLSKEELDDKLRQAEEKRNQLLEEAKNKAKEMNDKVDQVSKRKRSEDEETFKERKEHLEKELEEAQKRREKFLDQTKEKCKQENEKVANAQPNEADRKKGEEEIAAGCP